MKASRCITLTLAMVIGVATGDALVGQTITEFPIPDPVGSLAVSAITSGPDGALWFADSGAIGRITTQGASTLFFLDFGAPPYRDIVTGPDGNLWFSVGQTPPLGGGGPLPGFIGRITTGGVFTKFILSGRPEGMASGPDGSLWFTESGLLIPFAGDAIGRITPSGTITEFPFPTPDLSRFPGGIALGPDGNLWFAEAIGKIGRITTTGEIREFAAGTAPGFLPAWVAFGPDGNLWFTESSKNGLGRIGRMTPSGLVTEFHVPGSNVSLQRITSGADGNLWFTSARTDFAGNAVGRISPNGIIEMLPLPTPSLRPDGITSGPDGNIWFAGRSPFGSKIGQVNIGCHSGATNLCLNQGRFRVDVSWTASKIGQSGAGQTMPLTSDSGAFWFFQPSNIELVVKVLDGRAINGHFWVFYGALSNVGYTITVTDTETGEVRTYTNPEGQLASVADTEAF